MMSVKNRTIRIERYLVMQAIATETAAITESNLRVMLACWHVVFVRHCRHGVYAIGNASEIL